MRKLLFLLLIALIALDPGNLYGADYYLEKTVDATADTISPGFPIYRLHVYNTDAADNAWVRWDGSAATQNTADPTTDTQSIIVAAGGGCVDKEFDRYTRPTTFSVICATASCLKIRMWAED